MILAQANVALFRWSLDDPKMHEFVSQIDTMNVLAESSPGFIWRETDTVDSQNWPSPYATPLLFFNLSVWKDVESLWRYVYKTEHIEVLKRRAEWTEEIGTSPLIMWWIQEDQRPTPMDAVERFQALNNGATCEGVFTFLNPNSAPLN